MKSYVSRLSRIFCFLLPFAVSAQVAPGPTTIIPGPTTGPSGPPTGIPDPTTIEVAPAVKRAIDTSHAAWKNDGGAEFKSGITYVQGVPTMMLITTADETPDKAGRRKRAIVASFDFLLDGSAFSKAVICVVAADPKNPRGQTAKNYEILRGNYQEALRKAAKVDDPKAGAQKARETDSIVESVCTDLGVK